MARTSSNDLNKTRYTRRDYESIKSDLINAIPSLTQEWTSREEADPGIVLIKLMAMFGDTLSYNVDKIALELYISTVTQRKNCAKILALLGYKMHWYRSGRVMAHVRLIVNQDAEGNLGHVILKPYETQFVAGNIRYTVVEQSTGSGDIDIYSDTSSTEVKLIEGTPVTVNFDKNVLVKNRYYFGNYNLDETEIVLEIDNVSNSKVTCQLVDSLYLVSSNTIIYYEFGVDEYDRPYIQLCDGWEDIAGTDTAKFSVTYILSSGSLGNVSDNAFSNVYNYESENVSPSNLVINNLSNLTNFVDNGVDLESYNSPGYDPQSVQDARIDSAKYVFTHDTLVTSSDYEKACKRANQDITVSKLVDGQVVINDMLDLNDICSRALDRFSKTYVVEESLTDPGVEEINQYLLAYQVILYLAYGNFKPQTNYYFKTLDMDSIWSLRRPGDGDSDDNVDPYGRDYWGRVETFESNADLEFQLSGAKDSTLFNQSISVEVTVNEAQIDPKDYTYDGLGHLILIMDELPLTLGREFIVNVDTVPQTIDDFTYNPDPETGTGEITIIKNIPSVINSLIINTEDWSGDCTYNPVTDTVKIVSGPEIPSGSTINIKKIYSSRQEYIDISSDSQFSTLPDAITSLFINGSSVSNYNYDKESGKITLINTNYVESGQTSITVDSIIVNGKVLTNPVINSETVELKAPGYYPYKPTDNVLLQIRDLLSTLKILNVDLEFGTMKVFPFKVEGTIHLTETVAPAEALQIIEIIDDALDQAYYPDLHPIGEKPDFIEIVDIIQNSDPRIKYFDAINNIVVWAPEVQKRLEDFDDIFDTTSAIMYNGLSKAFNLNKRFMRYKFKNTAVNLDPQEEDLLQTYGSEGGIYDIPSDYGTAYLLNYSRVANLDYTLRVLPNTYITLQLNNLEELEALNEDLNIRGPEYIRYVRHLESADPVTPDSTIYPIDSLEELSSITVTDEDVVNYTLEDVPVTIPNDNLQVTVTRGRYQIDEETVEYTITRESDSYLLEINQFYETEISSTGSPTIINTGLPNINIYKVLVNNTEIPSEDYEVIEEGSVQINSELESGDIVKILYYLEVDDVININHKFYEYVVNLEPSKVIDKITYKDAGTQTPSTSLYSVEVKGTTYYAENFAYPDSGEISQEYNDDLLIDFNSLTTELDQQDLIGYTFKFNQLADITFVVQTAVDQIDSGQEVVPPDYYVEKYTLINNTGLQWIKED